MISAGFLLAVLFIVVFYIFPSLKEIKNNSQDMVLGQENLIFWGQQVNKVEAFKANYIYKPNLDKIESLYIDSKNPSDFFEFLDQTSRECQAQYEVSISPESLGGKDADYINFHVSLRASLSNTVKFLERIEIGPYLLKVQNFSVKSYAPSGSSRRPAVGGVAADFLIKAYIKQ